MADKATPWNLTITSDLRLLAMVRTFIESVCRTSNCDDKVTDALVIATDEAVNNIIRHAHRQQPNAVIQIQCFVNADRIEVRLYDEGEPFDLAAVPHLDPSELRIGGRGVFLMRALMDELSCQPREEGGNALHMVKRRPSDASLRKPA